MIKYFFLNFRKTKKTEERKKIASEELIKWKEYIENRKNDLPEVPKKNNLAINVYLKMNLLSFLFFL